MEKATLYTYICQKLIFDNMDIDTLDGLMKCPLMNGLSQKEVMNLMHQVRYRIVHYEKGSTFANAGEFCLHADIVLAGELMASIIAPSGRVVQMNLHHAGNMVAPAFLYAKDNRYPVTVKAAQDSTVLRLMPDAMETLFKKDNRISANFIFILSNIVSFQAHKIGVLSMNLREKLIVVLKEAYQKQGSNRVMLPTRQELANTLGVQKFSVQRTLTELEKNNIIKLDGKYVEIISPFMLKV